MNKPFYGIATMPKSERGSFDVIQSKFSIILTYQGREHMISLRRGLVVSCQNGGINPAIKS